MKVCYYCKGDITQKKVIVDYRWGNKLCIIKDVPALVCDQCGEKYFDSKVSRTMEKIVLNGENKIDLINVPVCEFSI